MSDILITGGRDFPAIPGRHQELLRESGWTAHLVPGPVTDAKELLRIIKEHGPFKRGMLAYVDNLNREVIAALADGGTQIISRSGTGYNTIDVEACREFGVRVAITKGANARFIAEAALAMLLELELRLGHIATRLRESRTSKILWGIDVPRRSIVGKTIAVLGFGDIGRAMVRLCIAHGLNVNVWSQSWDVERQASLARFSEFGESGAGAKRFAHWSDAVANADYVSLHMAANAETECWVDAGKLAQFKYGAVLINSSRGQLLNDADVLAALRSGKLRGAALDHHRVQPVPADYPYLAMENVLCTPHAAWQTPECTAAQLSMAMEHLVMFDWAQPEMVNTFVV